MFKRRWIIIVLLVVIAAGCSNNKAGTPTKRQKNEPVKTNYTAVQQMKYPGDVTPNFSADDLTAPPSGNWLTNGGNIYNGRYSPLNKVNTTNVAKLKGEWVTSLGSGTEFKFSGEATPLVFNGVMFAITGANDVSALDAKTGKFIWQYHPKITSKLSTVCCGWTSRGVALGDGKVYVGLLDARLVALDQKTGKVVWETTVADWKKGYTVTGAPLFYNGKVYTGVAGGEYGIRGRLTAYDAKSGKEVWKTYTIPGPGEKGHETWPKDNNAWKTGGAPVWQTPAVDPKLGLIYFSTGNASPDLDGSNRKGDNLYANSILALDAETGKYKWHFQEVHHDIWDLDPANPVVLFDVTLNGKPRQGIAQAGKTGWVYLLDRTNGKPLIGIEEKPVSQDDRQKTSPTQPIPIGDAFVPQKVTKEDVKRDLPKEFKGNIGGIFSPFWDKPLTVKPSPQGGANWPPSAYNPNTEYFYVLGNDNYFALAHYGDDKESQYKEGKEYIGSIWQPVSKTPQRGTVTALDIKTNKIVWQKHWDTIAYSGILTTKGNLVFVGHNDGRIIAYDARNGKQLWDFQMDAGANAPPITYEVDGKQYISIYSAGNSLAGSKHGDKIYTFSLEGTYTSLKNITQKDINTTSLDDDGHDDSSKQGNKPATNKEKTNVTAVNHGKQVYENNCLACHGAGGTGGHNGPNLKQSDIAKHHDQLIKQIKNGSGAMPPFGNNLSQDEINDLAEYIKVQIAGGD